MRRLWSNGPVLLALASLFWAGSIVSGRAVAAQVPPALFTLLRWGGALLIIAPLAWRHLPADGPKLLRRWWLVGMLGLLGVVAYNNLVYLGVHSTTAVNALLLQSATPLFILLASLALFGERPGLLQVVAIFTSVAGVVVIAGQGSVEVLRHLTVNPGDLLVTLACVLNALYSALLRLRPRVHPFSLLAGNVAVGVVMLVPIAGAEYATGARLQPTPLAIGAIVYACIFPAFTSYLFYNRGVELIGAARAGQFLHLMPVFGVVLAMLFLGETLHLYHAAGIALIAAGLWLASTRARPLSP